MPTAEQSSEFLLRRPLFSWTRIKGESDVQGGGGNGSITEGGGGGTNGGSTSPIGQAQILVQAVEDPPHVVGNQTLQPAAHLLTHGEGQIEVAGLRERGQAVKRGLLVPGFQIESR